ncbi:hypothetical protein FC96_GL000106 [Secundilactobacillus kimchicus JCM 15530]|uniref:Uncharacterized protein n=1 Tax=Secundilactobacillus kimchicus JCM 15530 TaxID=1302272 RepID=A0A0R1HZT4_9LACO|nr:hypothetical protein FC96_GL000106 [Secundilactobacillus kimchicus JCM 15530]
MPQLATDIRVLDAHWTVFIPRKTCPSGTSPRFVARHICATFRIVSRLVFPRNDALFHVDVPTTRTGTIDPVSCPHNFIMSPTLFVKLFPTPTVFFQLGKGTVELFNALEKAGFFHFLRPPYSLTMVCHFRRELVSQ